MAGVEVLGNAKLDLQGGDAGFQEDVVIRVTEGAGIDAVDSAAMAALLENVEELETIETVGVAGQSLALASSKTYGETGRYLEVPANIAELVDIDEDDEPQKDMTKLLEHLAKKDGKLAEVKSL